MTYKFKIGDLVYADWNIGRTLGVVDKQVMLNETDATDNQYRVYNFKFQRHIFHYEDQLSEV